MLTGKPTENDFFQGKTGAGGGIRTHTGLCIPLDFESSASTNFATPALWSAENYIISPGGQQASLCLFQTRNLHRSFPYPGPCDMETE